MSSGKLPAVIEAGTLTTKTDTYIVPALVADLLALGRILHRQLSQPEHARRAYARA
jgi:hypothetical protein